MTTSPLKVHIAPDANTTLSKAVVAAGAELSSLSTARVLVWTNGAEGFPSVLPDNIEWVQLRSAGIESFFTRGIIDDRRLWTNASGFYADNVAEHALALLLAGLRQVHVSARSRWDKEAVDPSVRSLRGATVGLVGAGGIGRALISRLLACGADVIAVNSSGNYIDGTLLTVPAREIGEIWSRCDHVVLAAPATEDTHHLINDEVLTALPSHAWIVNIARGSLIDQSALYRALTTGAVAGAALDVTDPEPLPVSDPLWSLPNVLITPHVANPESGLNEALAPWLTENLRRFSNQDALLAVVDVNSGY